MTIRSVMAAEATTATIFIVGNKSAGRREDILRRLSLRQEELGKRDLGLGLGGVFGFKRLPNLATQGIP